MDSCIDGAALEPRKCNEMGIDQKRELVYEMSSWSDGASETLQTWSRQEILQILCAEMGKERKYTGLTKVKMIENLLRIVSEKKSGVQESKIFEQQPSKRQRKLEHPSRLPVVSTNNLLDDNSDYSGSVYCENSACKAVLNQGDVFCKRCSCCICRKFDDNKDPSLWLSCFSEPPFLGRSCNMSCHVECFLKHGASGNVKVEKDADVDGVFYCVACGKGNDLLSCWRKQLMIARDTRRVDILCYRLSLSQRLLAGRKLYQKMVEIVDKAVKLVEAEVGLLTGLPVKKARGIVNRLSSGQQVQGLCNSALQALESLLLDDRDRKFTAAIARDCRMVVASRMVFEDVSETSVTVVLVADSGCVGKNSNFVYTLWHHKAGDEKSKSEPTSTFFEPDMRFFVSGLLPGTEYVFKVVCFDNDEEVYACESRLTTSFKAKESIMERSESPATNWSTLSNPSSAEDETCKEQVKPESLKVRDKLGEATSTDNGMNAPLSLVPYVGGPDMGLPITPCRLETLEVVGRRPKSSSKRGQENEHEGVETKKRSRDGVNDGPNAAGLEKYVRTIRWLECEGHIDKSFRQKFLTWYSMRATPQEERVVKVFMEIFVDDPASLAEQLVDTFEDIVSSKRTSVVPTGFCVKLWH